MAARPVDNVPMPKTFPASSTDQLMFLNNTNSDGQMHGMITFSGRVDASLVARAIRLSLDAEPVLGCRLVVGPLRLRWHRAEGLDGIDLCPIVEAEDAFDEAIKSMASPMEASKAPQVRACLFRGSERDVLCVTMTHAVADGGGFKEYLGLLASIYRQVRVDPGYRPAVNLRGSRSPGQLVKHVGLARLVRSGLHFSVPRLEWCFPVTGPDFSGRSFLTADIGTGAIRAYARGRGVTVNDVLLTAYYRALFKVLDPPAGRPLPVTVPVNLRRYLPSGKAGGIGTLSGLYIPAISREPGEAFEATLARLHGAMDAAKKMQMELAQMLFLQMAFIPGHAPMRYAVRYAVASRARALMTIPCFSNLGAIRPEDLDFGDLRVADVSLFGPATFPPYFDFTVYSFGDALRCSISYCDSAADVKLVKGLLDAFRQEVSGPMSNG